MRKISCFWWAGLLLALILSGCGKLERKGPEPVNIPPQVFFANIPPESTKFSISPRVYWYGTDKDGFITAFQYAVITDSLITFWGGGDLDLDGAKDSLKKIGPDSAGWVNSISRMNVFGVHVPAEGGNQGNVKLYAALVESVYTAQHVFLRAVDNRDGISEIKTRMFWRNNHAPQCTLEIDDSVFVRTNFYCLPETTQTWKGISISWVGLDTLDYPDKRRQPDFYFKWELWGPYEDTLKLSDPIATKVSFSLDSIQVGGEWIRDEWTLDKLHTFKNLENYPGRGYGWYQFKVWSRDDAFVSSKEPATTFIRILKPLFRYADSARRTILILDVTKYGQSGGANNLVDVWPFYRDTALSQPDICDGFNIFLLGDKLPSEDSLSRYDLVILLNLGPAPGISEESYAKYMEYMNVGGFLWIIGLNNYGVGLPRGSHPLVVDVKPSRPNIYAVATEYLGVDGLFFAGYSAAGYDTTLEFIAAKPFGSWEVPLLEMDTSKVTKLNDYYTQSNPGLDFKTYGIPYVPYDELASSYDYTGRAPLERRVYSFVSRLGRNSRMEQMPCATTYIGPGYRTAEFAFPLNLMKNPGAKEAFRIIVNWFWEGV